jgi:hypothetical protein
MKLYRLRQGVSKSFLFCACRVLICRSSIVMPCRSDEESAQGPGEPGPVTPPRRRRNAGAGRDNSDAEIEDKNAGYDDEYLDQPFSPEPNAEKRQEKARATCVDYCKDMGYGHISSI